MWRLATVLVYLSSSALISPCQSAQAAPKRRKAREITLAEFVEKLKREGELTQFPAVLKKIMDFPSASTKKTLAAEVHETTDGASRLANIVFDLPDSGDEPVPIGLYWSSRLEVARTSESYDYRTTLDGVLKKATRIDGRLDENGKAVRGGGKLTQLDVKSQVVQERFKREVLDFWLRGKGRKKAASAKKPRSRRGG